MEITIPPPHSQWRRKLSASPHPPARLTWRTAHLYKTPQKRSACFFVHLSGNNQPIIHQIPYSHCNILLSNPCNLIFQEYANILKNCTTVFMGPLSTAKIKIHIFRAVAYTNLLPFFLRAFRDTATNVQERQQWVQQQQQCCFNSLKGFLFLPCSTLCAHSTYTYRGSGNNPPRQFPHHRSKPNFFPTQRKIKKIANLALNHCLLPDCKMFPGSGSEDLK